MILGKGCRWVPVQRESLRVKILPKSSIVTGRISDIVESDGGREVLSTPLLLLPSPASLGALISSLSGRMAASRHRI